MRRALLVAVVLAGCTPTNDPKLKEHVAQAKAGVARVKASADAYFSQKGHCPSANELERVLDPWGHPYVLLCPGQKGHAVDVVSRGADGDIGTNDDVRSWD